MLLPRAPLLISRAHQRAAFTHSRLWIGDRIAHLILHLDQIGGILRRFDALGDHDGNRLAIEAYDTLRQRAAMATTVLRRVECQVIRRKDPYHTGDPSSLFAIDGENERVWMR